MNIAIVDDDQKEIDTLSDTLKEYAALGKTALTINVFHSAQEILAAYRPYAYTAIFMDIYMDGKTGIEAAQEILSLDRRAIIIFLTSSDEHMPQAFSMHAYDYIGKPAKKERLFKVMDDVLLRKSELESSPTLTINCDRNTVSLPYRDIVYVRTADHNYLEIMDEAKNTYITRLTFSKVADTLAKDRRFLLIIRGIIVNMEYIHKLSGDICYLKNGVQLPINIRNAKELENIYQNFKFDSMRNESARRRNR
ncbi:MAG: response regulator transcription factor [Lachnospiraceae bacterium]|nr:response regulator transcription factor [Lachnospiraceae bacterium]